MFPETSSILPAEIISAASLSMAGHPLWQWGLFVALVAGLLAFDLGVLNKRDREIGVRQSLVLSTFYIAAGLGFGGFVWWSSGGTAAMEYATGFMLEKTLAMDNVFVIATIFAALAIPRHLQHRVLFWGILGVIMLRGIMIVAGAAAVTQFDWVLYLFAGFLVITAASSWSG